MEEENMETKPKLVITLRKIEGIYYAYLNHNQELRAKGFNLSQAIGQVLLKYSDEVGVEFRHMKGDADNLFSH